VAADDLWLLETECAAGHCYFLIVSRLQCAQPMQASRASGNVRFYLGLQKQELVLRQFRLSRFNHLRLAKK
jgi:hypothetical protein